MHNPIGIYLLTDWHHRNVASAEEYKHHITSSRQTMSLESMMISNESKYYLIVRDGYSPVILGRKIEGQQERDREREREREREPRGTHPYRGQYIHSG